MPHVGQDRLAVSDDPEVRVYQGEGVNAIGRGTPEPPPHRVGLARRRGRGHEGDVVLVHGDQLFGGLVRGGRPPALQGVVVDGVRAGDDDVARLLVDRHAADAAARVLDRLGRLAVAPPGDGQLQDARRRGDEQGGEARVDVQLDARDGLVRHGEDALLRPQVVDQVAADDGHGAVREADRELRQVLGRGEGRDLCTPRPRQPSSRHLRPGSRARAPTGNGFFPLLITTVLRHVGIPVFLTGLSSAHAFRTGWLIVSPVLGSSCRFSPPSAAAGRRRIPTLSPVRRTPTRE